MSLLRLLATTVTFAALSTAAFAQAKAQLETVSKAELPALIKEAIMNDPQMIMDALDKLRAEKTEAAKKEAMENLAKYKNDILNNTETPTAGASAKNADVTVVEFFDYHCGYCKHFLPELTKLIDQDKKVRVLFIDFPILSEDSNYAAKAAIAANRLDKSKYFAFHTELMAQKGKFDEATVMEVAKKVGIKPDALKAEIAKPEVSAQIDKNRELAGKLNIGGTPAVIVGDELLPGAMSYEQLKTYVENARKPNSPAAKPRADAAQ